MFSRPFVGLALAAAVAFSGPALAKDRADPIKMFDSDNDGTLDLAEVKKAASAMFAKLDPDRDGTLDARELRGRLSAKELAAADPDHDGGDGVIPQHRRRDHGSTGGPRLAAGFWLMALGEDDCARLALFQEPQQSPAGR